jgi:hypothetical protein
VPGFGPLLYMPTTHGSIESEDEFSPKGPPCSRNPRNYQTGKRLPTTPTASAVAIAQLIMFLLLDCKELRFQETNTNVRDLHQLPERG